MENQEIPALSIVIPVYNEEGNLRELHQRLGTILSEQIRKPHEIIFVDDGSSDDSWNIIGELHAKDKNICGFQLSRNFGHQYALKAGLDNARGEVVISMDADLQHPPELIATLLERWEEGYKIVRTVRKRTAEISPAKDFLSKNFYRVLQGLSETKITPGAADFLLLDAQVVQELRRMGEGQFFLRGLVSWLGYPSTIVEYEADKRFSGVSHYSFRRMLKLAINATMSFSTRPLRWASLAGLTLFAFAIVYAIYVICIRLFTDAAEPGWASVLLCVLLLSGVQLISIGLLGEYIGQIYLASRGRPSYVVNESLSAD